MASMFKRFKEWWMPVAKKIGEFQTKVILSLLYFLVIGPIALIGYLIRADLLKKKRKDLPSLWSKEREPANTREAANTIEGCKRQF